MTVDFNDYFWGEKNSGYEVLYQNMKYGLAATKELAEYFRERSNLEEYNSKLLTKLANKAGSSGGGTFSPLWIILKSTTERLSELHAQKVQKLTELVKNVTKYAEDLHKKHKSVKEDESGTQDAVQAMKESTAAVAKAKDIHNARMLEAEKARKDNSAKEIEKSEAKLRKHQDEYKALVDKHNTIKQEFEKKMTITCRRFQEMEEAHLKQMKEFLSSYMDIVQNNFDLVGQVHSDLKRQFLELTVDKLLEQFVLNKYTGLEKPELIELDFESGGAGGPHAHQQMLVNTATTTTTTTAAAVPRATSSSPAPSSLAGGLLESPTLSATSSSQPIAIGGGGGGGGGAPAKKESHLRSWFSSSSTAAVPTNSPVNLSTSPTATSVGSGLRFDGGLGGGDHHHHQYPAGQSQQQVQQQSQQVSLRALSPGPTGATNDSALSAGSAQSTSKQTSKPFYGDLFSFKHHHSTTTTTPSTNHNQPHSPNLPSNGHNGNGGNNSNQSPLMKQQQQQQQQQQEQQHLQDSLQQQHQQQQQQQPSSPPQQQQQQQQKSSRRTTSLLNLFMSNSQGSRDSRDSNASAVGVGSRRNVANADVGRNSVSSSGATVSAPTSPNDPENGGTTIGGVEGTSDQQQQQQQQQSASSASSFIGRNPLLRGSKFSGFLRSRREKAKSKKAKKKKDSTENSSAKEDNIADGDSKGDAANADSATNLQTTSAVSATNVAPTATPEVDEDGYSIQPRETTWDSATITEKSNNFYSSSDSDSEDEREERKIHVEIKPLNNGAAPISASVDELRATVENLSLSPIGILTSARRGSSFDPHHQDRLLRMKRSKSVSQQIGDSNGGSGSKPSQDLLSLNHSIFQQQQQQQHHQQHQLNQQLQQQQQQQQQAAATQQQLLQHQMSVGNASLLNNNSSAAAHITSPNASNASTPTTVHPYAPLQSPTLSMSTSSNNRYADLGDIFSEVGDISVSAPASANLSKLTQRQIPTPTSTGGSSIAIPRPPSRRSEAAVARDRVSPASQIARADSVGSLEFRSPSVGIGSSRGPSPLTIGMSDTIPLAVAFHEIIHAYFKGADESRCQVKMSGDMMISFPAGIVNVLTNNPNPAKLGFRIKNLQNLDNVLPNKQLISIDRLQSTSFSTTLEFNMPALTAILRRQSEQNPNAPHINVDILKYQIKAKPGASSCPFQLVSYWKCEQRHTDIKIDYKYNCHAMAQPSPLLNVSISVPVDGGVKNVQSKPHSAWQGESNRLVWNFTDISQHSESGGVDTLRARLEVGSGPSNPAIISTQFNCEGTTLSGIEFELAGTGYRLSLVKRRFVSGKYICEGDGIRTAKTPTPPNVSGVMSPIPFGSTKSANSSSGGTSG